MYQRLSVNNLVYYIMLFQRLQIRTSSRTNLLDLRRSWKEKRNRSLRFTYQMNRRYHYHSQTKGCVHGENEGKLDRNNGKSVRFSAISISNFNTTSISRWISAITGPIDFFPIGKLNPEINMVLRVTCLKL